MSIISKLDRYKAEATPGTGLVIHTMFATGFEAWEWRTPVQAQWVEAKVLGSGGIV